jgi:hypothetical protein
MTPTVKKVLGMSLMVFFGIVSLFFVVVLISNVLSTNTTEQGAEVLSFLLPLTMFVGFFLYGKNLYYKGVSESLIVTKTINPMTKIVFQTHVTLQEFTKLQMTLVLKMPFIVYFFVLASIFTFMPFLKDDYTLEKYWIHQIVGLFVLIILPSMQYRTINKFYHSNTLLNQLTNYEINPTTISITNNDMNVTVYLRNLSEVNEYKNWFILLQKNGIASFIPKTSFSSQEDIDTLRDIFIVCPNIVKNLSAS